MRKRVRSSGLTAVVKAADAGAREQTGAVELREARCARIGDQLDQVCSRQIEAQAAHAADLEARVVQVQVDAGGLQSADVGVEVLDVAVAEPQRAVRRVAVDASASGRDR